ncbi:MAG: nuclear transport factor 2 family protein, partial [Saprospiraceae bacterium]|nr:nuclear transport factor 2 family protein [Saprospiraceae bacterium]
MKLTRQQEEEISKVVQDSWNAYFDGDLDKWAACLAVDYKNIGTTQEEIWESREEIREYTERMHAQLGQAEIRNRQAKIYPVDPHVMVHEFGDVYLRTAEGWQYYAKFRVSSLLAQIDGEWKIVHQHGSYPDSRTQEGEAFAFDQILAENKKLQAAVDERTRELQNKSRALEIEAALEKVRSKALAMHSSEDFLATAREMFSVLNDLGINPIRSGLSVVTDEEAMAWEAWSITSGADGEALAMSAQFTSKVYSVSETIFHRWQKQEPHWQIVLAGDDLRDFIDGMPRDYVPVLGLWNRIASEGGKVVFH